jgi:hypothetical protein
MANQLALKRLAVSDLLMFEPYFHATGQRARQKAIILNSNVFREKLYPEIETIGPTMGNRIPVSVTIFGPGGRGEQRLNRRPIQKLAKNWRLSGNFIQNPPQDPVRYNSLQEGDLAVFRFDGEPVPISVELCLLSQTDRSDAAMWQELAPRVPGVRRSMVRLFPDDFAAVIDRVQPAADHPIRSFARDPDVELALEEAALGDEKPLRTLLRRRGIRRISTVDVAEASANAQRTGRDGENLINASILDAIAAATLVSADWTSNADPYAPYDFRVVSEAEGPSKIEVKSTHGPFGYDFHISMAQLIEAAQGAERYDLYRVYELNTEGGKLRVARDIRDFAKAVIAGLTLPDGVRCDGCSVAVSAAGLIWEAETYMALPLGEDEDELA